MANLWVLMRRSIVMLAWLIMAIVRLLPWRPGLRWRIDIPLALWLRRRSYRELLSLPVVGTVWRWWGVVRLGVGREVLRSGVVVVGCHVGDFVVVVVVVKILTRQRMDLYTSVETRGVKSIHRSADRLRRRGDDDARHEISRVLPAPFPPTWRFPLLSSSHCW